MRKITEDQLGDEGVNFTIKDLNITEIVPNIIDNFMVTIYEGHQTIVIPPTITGIQFNAWYKGRGGVFAKDILKYTLFEQIPGILYEPLSKYVHIKGDSVNCIARLISEEELFSFTTMKLVDGKIKDSSYMILRHINNDESLTNSKKLIEDKDSYTEIDDSIILSMPKVISHEEDPEYHVGSVSLFNE